MVVLRGADELALWMAASLQMPFPLMVSTSPSVLVSTSSVDWTV
jgi:hypothetical protein